MPAPCSNEILPQLREGLYPLCGYPFDTFTERLGFVHGFFLGEAGEGMQTGCSEPKPSESSRLGGVRPAVYAAGCCPSQTRRSGRSDRSGMDSKSTTASWVLP